MKQRRKDKLRSELRLAWKAVQEAEARARQSRFFASEPQRLAIAAELRETQANLAWAQHRLTTAD